eukprot:4225548-Prorocentrum_lima.AAC.1
MVYAKAYGGKRGVGGKPGRQDRENQSVGGPPDREGAGPQVETRLVLRAGGQGGRGQAERASQTPGAEAMSLHHKAVGKAQ